MRYIYRISFPDFLSKKVYIGQTKKYKRRCGDHKRISINGESDNHFSTIHAAIRKYGIENMIFEVIAICLDDTDECANYCEKLIILQYDSFKNGYNETEGGDGSSGRIPWNKNKKCPNISIGRLGIEPHNKGKTGKDNKSSLFWKIYFEDGKIIEVHGLKQWCAENGYSNTCLCYLQKNKIKYHKDIIKIEKIKKA